MPRPLPRGLGARSGPGQKGRHAHHVEKVPRGLLGRPVEGDRSAVLAARYSPIERRCYPSWTSRARSSPRFRRSMAPVPPYAVLPPVTGRVGLLPRMFFSSGEPLPFWTAIIRSLFTGVRGRGFPRNTHPGSRIIRTFSAWNKLIWTFQDIQDDTPSSMSAWKYTKADMARGREARFSGNGIVTLSAPVS